jgi:hypothetical protein
MTPLARAATCLATLALVASAHAQPFADEIEFTFPVDPGEALQTVIDRADGNGPQFELVPNPNGSNQVGLLLPAIQSARLAVEREARTNDGQDHDVEECLIWIFQGSDVRNTPIGRTENLPTFLAADGTPLSLVYNTIRDNPALLAGDILDVTGGVLAGWEGVFLAEMPDDALDIDVFDNVPNLTPYTGVVEVVRGSLTITGVPTPGTAACLAFASVCAARRRR